MNRRNGLLAGTGIVVVPDAVNLNVRFGTAATVFRANNGTVIVAAP